MENCIWFRDGGTDEESANPWQATGAQNKELVQSILMNAQRHCRGRECRLRPAIDQDRLRF